MTDNAASIHRSRRRRSAFNLLELIVTISIVAILMALAAPSIIGIIASSRLTGSGDFVYNKLSQARQRAITDSRDIRVRIYSVKDDDDEEGGTNFSALQFFGWTTEGTDELLTDFFPLTEGTVISSDSDLSSLIGGLPLNDEASSNPGSGKQKSFVEFAFHPDGSTNLPLTSTADGADAGAGTVAENIWFLTIVPDSSAAPVDQREGARPDNFYTIQIDPDTGGLTVFRP